LTGTEKVLVMVPVWPEAIVPKLQGNAVVQAPAFDTNVNPEGVGSLTCTEQAAPGPLFVTTVV
jgi:hypothetical protein